MCPVLLRLGTIEIQSWWVMFFMGFIIAGLLACKYIAFVRRTKGEDYCKDLPTVRQTAALFVCFLIGAVVGSRLVYCLWHLDRYASDPWKIFLIFDGGLISFGGLVLATIFGIWYANAKRLNVLKTADLIIVYVPIIEALKRLGCFLGGCCFGRPTNLAIGVRPPRGIVFYHPAQLYFVVLFIVIFFALKFLRRRPHREGMVFFSYFLFYFFGRFFIEFFRVEYAMCKGMLSLPQVICIIGFLLTSAVFYIKFHTIQFFA